MAAVDSIKPNMFTAFAGGLQGVKPAEKPVTPVASIMGGGSNPFAPTDDKKQMGVGLVNSNLQNMSYKLPNGKNSVCSTIGIA